jgi:hypothetical protein
MSSFQAFNRVYRLEQSQSCWYFRPSFVSYSIAPLTFSLVHLPHPPPLPKVQVQDMHIAQLVCGWEGVGGVQLCWRQHSVSDQIQNLQNWFTTPKENLG